MLISNMTVWSRGRELAFETEGPRFESPSCFNCFLVKVYFWISQKILMDI